jgi:hypothetical protein
MMGLQGAIIIVDDGVTTPTVAESGLYVRTTGGNDDVPAPRFSLHSLKMTTRRVWLYLGM